MEFSCHKRNFAPEEDELLISLVSQHRNIIEMSTDCQQKYLVWRKITTLFEQKTGVSRSNKSLRGRYGYLKRSLRKRIAAKEERLSRTGSHFIRLSSNEEQLLQILKDSLVAGMGNNFDDDRLDEQTTTSFTEDDEQANSTTPLTEDEIVTVTFDEGVISEGVGIQTVSADKSRDIEPSEADQRKLKRETVTAQELAKAKIDFLESEKRIKLEQHEIKLESHEMRQALRKAKLELLQAKVKLVLAKTKEIEEKEKIVMNVNEIKK